jgi:DNA-directed RNA polymerase specialized sigma subunit
MTKEQLKSYQALMRELEGLRTQIKTLAAKIRGVSAVTLSDMPKPTTKGDQSDGICKLADMQGLYESKVKSALEEMADIEQAISQLEDPIQRTLMRYRYIEGLEWEKICVKLNYSWRQIHRIHSMALNNLGG